jgi:hypothetical protein
MVNRVSEILRAICELSTGARIVFLLVKAFGTRNIDMHSLLDASNNIFISRILHLTKAQMQFYFYE